MRGLYAAITETARLHDRHHKDLTAARVDMLGYVFNETPRSLIRSMTDEAIELRYKTSADAEEKAAR